MNAQIQPNSKKPWLALTMMSAAIIAAAFTAPHEGDGPVVHGMHQAYLDTMAKPARWTICHGHTAKVNKGDTATDAQCDAYMVVDMAVARATVDRCINVPLTVTQAAALYDLTFNEGPNPVCASWSTLRKKANAWDFTGMCNAFSLWNYAGGQVWPGLTTRRMDAKELCLLVPANQQLVYPLHWKKAA